MIVPAVVALFLCLGSVSPARGDTESDRADRHVVVNEGAALRDMDHAQALDEGRYGEIAGQIAAALQAPRAEQRLDELVRALGSKGAGSYEPTVSLVEELLQEGNLHWTIAAADILLKTVMNVKRSSYGDTREIRTFPDELTERAASLLDHPDPVVQAMAEWGLALRVKKQNEMTRHMDRLLLPGTCEKGWYLKWRKRSPEHDLRDDYGRQLVHLGRHRCVAGLQEDIEKVAGRIGRMSRAPGTRGAGAELERFRKSLAAVRSAAEGTNLLRAHTAYIAFREAAREVIAAGRREWPAEGFIFYTNPRITGGVWNVNVVVTGRTNIPVGDVYVKRSADPAAPPEALNLKRKLGDGSARGIDLHWAGDRLLFSYWVQPVGGECQPFGWDWTRSADLYEMHLPTGEITRLTSNPAHNDVEPCFLPDGGYVFASDRNSFGNQCAGPFLQNKRCTSLFRLDPRQSKEPIAISNNKDFDRHPHVLNDGTVAFMHWEYQERGLYTSQNIWRCRPDGTSMDAFYKQHISVPYSIRDARQAPDSDLCVATCQGHHDAQDGPVILFNPSMGVNNERAMWNVTPGTSPVEGGLGPLRRQIVPEGGVENRGGFYINPFPISEKAFLAGHCMSGNEAEFALYYIDVWGNKELIHKDEDMSCFMPYPLRQRERPPLLADSADPQADYATAYVDDVYRDLPGVEKGAVKYLRISQRLFLPAPVDYDAPDYTYNHYHYLPGDSTSYHFGHWTWAPTRTVGTVKVEDDGSAYFKVPAGIAVFFQALDENHCEVRRMRSFVTLQRGELRGCMGCHETRAQTTRTRATYSQKTLAKRPQTPEPPPWGINTVFDYRKHVQPVLDEHCVSCHGRHNPKAGLDFNAREIGGFAQSFRTMHGLGPDDPTPIKYMKWHLELHPEARDDKYVAEKKNGEYPDVHRGSQKLIQQMEENKFPGMLISISNRHAQSGITMPYQFGANKSRLIRRLLDDPEHSKIKARMSREEWLTLVTWVDYNAPYHGTVINVRNYRENGTLTRVPYYLPLPWIPADTNPLFYNTAEGSKMPRLPEHSARMPD